ncbi:MAG: hypothetical protein GY807_10650 [Gammaproteobacteria bacterium]|nr:hypothetical protein [Gammaproteobacteria bacterium]
MRSPLIDRLLEEFDYPEISLDSLDGFVNTPGEGILFFAGDPKKYRETNDVAVILPELIQAFHGRLRPAVVARTAELKLQMHYGFKAWPALVLVRNGGYLGCITGVQNWEDYLQEINKMLVAEPTKPPGFKLPVVSAK